MFVCRISIKKTKKLNGRLRTTKTEINLIEKVDTFKAAARPLMEWLEHQNPHTVVIVDSMGAQLMSGEIGVPSPMAIKYREENNDLAK